MSQRYSILNEYEAESLIHQRQEELRRLQSIETLTSQLSKTLLLLNDQLSKLQIGTDSVSQITGNWIQIVRAVSLAANSISNIDAKDENPLTERLVRCALDELGTIVKQLDE